MVLCDITIAGEINLDLVLFGLPENIPVGYELLASGFEVTFGGPNQTNLRCIHEQLYAGHAWLTANRPIEASRHQES
jgi:hypothetical protein